MQLGGWRNARFHFPRREVKGPGRYESVAGLGVGAAGSGVGGYSLVDRRRPKGDRQGDHGLGSRPVADFNPI